MLGLGRKGVKSGGSDVASPDLEAVERVLPDRERWEGFVKRLILCCGELELADGGGVAAHCVAVGCEAVGALERSRLWERLLPDGRKEREGFEDRLRVGLFMGGCLRTLLPLLCKVEVRVQGKVWEPFEDSLPDFVKSVGEGGEVEVEWRDREAHGGRVLTLASLFLGRREVVEVLTPVVAQEVFDCLRPGGDRGLFGTMMGDVGAVEEEVEVIDVAGVFIEGLRRVVLKGYLGVNRVPGEFFLCDDICFLAAPNGVNVVLRQLRKAGHDALGNRGKLYEALAEKGFLVGVKAGEMLTYKGVLRGSAWDGPLEIFGLPVATGVLWPEKVPEWMLEGKVILARKEEVV